MSNDASSQPKPGGALNLWGVLAFVFFALVIVICIRGMASTDPVTDGRAAERIKLREAIKDADKAKLESLVWIDKAKGVVQLPIDDAKKAIVAKLAEKKPAATQVKLDPTLPMPAPYDPNAKEPATPALPSAPQGADTIKFGMAPHSTQAAGADRVSSSDTAPAPRGEPITQVIATSATTEITK